MINYRVTIDIVNHVLYRKVPSDSQLWGGGICVQLCQRDGGGAFRVCTSVTCTPSRTRALAWQTARTPSASVCLSSKSQLSTKHTEDLWRPPPSGYTVALTGLQLTHSHARARTHTHTRALLLSDQIQPRARRPGELIIFIKSSWSRRMDFLTSFKGWFSSCSLIPPQLWPPMMGSLLVGSSFPLTYHHSSFMELVSAPHSSSWTSSSVTRINTDPLHYSLL